MVSSIIGIKPRWWFCLAFVLSLSVAAQGGSPSCYDLGFKDTLLCSNCEDLKKYVPDEGKVDSPSLFI
jgi:hypothetical protein